MSDAPSSRPVTQKDIALKMGLNQATVSRALKDDGRISPQQRKAIQKVATSMGYEPNPTATVLSHFRRSSKVAPVHAAIAWINAWADPAEINQYKEFVAYHTGAKNAAAKLGYHLDEFFCRTPEEFSQTASVLLSRGITGVIIPPHPKDRPEEEAPWSEFPWEHFATVRLGRSVPFPRANLVTSNETYNTITAFEAMQQRGYTRIGLVHHQSATSLFDAGFLKARNLVPPDCQVPIFITNPWDASTLGPKLEEWIEQEQPDAVLTDTFQIPDVIRECGYRIPEDLGVAVTNILDAKVDAGMMQRPEEIGRVAILMVNSLLSDNDRGIPDIPREALIRGVWVDGESLPVRT